MSSKRETSCAYCSTSEGRRPKSSVSILSDALCLFLIVSNDSTCAGLSAERCFNSKRRRNASKLRE